MTLLSREINQVSPSSLPTLVENAFQSSNFDGVIQQANHILSHVPPTPMSLVPFSPVGNFSPPTTNWFAPTPPHVTAALSMRTQPETLAQSTVTRSVQSNQVPLPSNIASIASHQPSSSGNTVHGQTTADQKLQIGLMSLKLPLPSFCPLTHNPREWLENFDMYCKNASKAYNLPLEKLITDNLFSLFPKTEKSWLMGKIFGGHIFCWETLKEQLLDHFSRLCNTKFKEIYMRE